MASTNKIFIDTSFFNALVDKTDDFHKDAVHIWSKLKDENADLITSNFILDESFTLIRVRCGIEKALELRFILSESGAEIKILRTLAADEANAWNWFVKNWSKLSFTDCVSFALMKRLNLTRVASFDTDFKRAGFILAK